MLVVQQYLWFSAFFLSDVDTKNKRSKNLHELGIFLSNGQASKGDGRLDEHTVQNGILLVHTTMMVHEIV